MKLKSYEELLKIVENGEEIAYVMPKPGDFANNKYVIEFIKYRMQNLGLRIIDEGYIKYDKARAARHYVNKLAEPYYPQLEGYMTSDKAYGMIVAGPVGTIVKVREDVGPTKINDEVIAKNPCVVNTIRYIVPERLGLERRVTQNVVHASDSVKNALEECKIYLELRREYIKQHEEDKTK